MDLSTVIGLVIGIGGILVGNFMEGGHLSSLVQFTAAFIVFGGTFGAALVSNRWSDVKLGLKLAKWGFRADTEDEELKVAAELVDAAKIARKESILALEKRVDGFTNSFMRDVFRFIVDGVEGSHIKSVFETRMEEEEDKLLAGAKLWSDAGGYAPTIGIIGAVLGLIHVMGNLTNTAELGKGIAVAFVATIYGVGSANLVFLPLANKIKSKIRKKTELNRMILDGGTSILEGLSPFIVSEKLRSYTSMPPEGR